MNFKNILKNPYLIFKAFADRGYFKKMDDKLYIKLLYRARVGKWPNLKNPITFNEKLQWLKLNYRNPEYSDLVDKYEVKDYISKTVGGEYVIPTIGVWDSVEDIDFDNLPEQFVLKCTHDSGGIVICKDKTELDIAAVKSKIKKSLGINFFYSGREWPYKNVKPRIIAEKYMTDGTGNALMDYKILCFNGEPKLIEIHKGRFTGNHTQDFYDVEWNLTEFIQPSDPPSGIYTEKPECLDEMIQLTRKLAEGFPHVRVDWYYIKGQLYFGELTFFDASGFCPFLPGQDEILGSWLKLPEPIENFAENN